MKNSVGIAICAIILSACSGFVATEKTISMANPASVFCAEKGGKSKVKKDDKGNQYSMCYLLDGRVIEEWEFYRQHHTAQ